MYFRYILGILRQVTWRFFIGK